MWTGLNLICLGTVFLDRKMIDQYKWPKIVVGEDCVMHKMISWYHPDDSMYLLFPITYYDRGTGVEY